MMPNDPVADPSLLQQGVYPDLQRIEGFQFTRMRKDLTSFSDEVVLASLLESPESTQRNEPLSRWFKYQFYIGFIRCVEDERQIPEGYTVYRPDERSLRDWIDGPTDLWGKLQEKLIELLQALRAAGGSFIRELCKLYGEFMETVGGSSKKIKFSLDALNLALMFASVKAFIAAYGGDIVYAGGVPITTFLLLFIKYDLTGELDKLCAEEKYQQD